MNIEKNYNNTSIELDFNITEAQWLKWLLSEQNLTGFNKQMTEELYGKLHSIIQEIITDMN